MTKRFERQPPDKIKLLPNDGAILRAVFEARYITAAHIARLLFKPTLEKWAYARLRALFDMKFLSKRLAFPNTADVYFLGLRGKHYFERLGYERAWLDRVVGVAGSDPVDTALWMPHDLTLSRLYVSARLEAQVHGWEVEWKNARVLEVENLGVQPDGWVRVSAHGRSASAYIEFTDEMPKRDELERKLEAYEPINSKVLWVTTSETKLKKLKSAVEDPKYAFALIDDCREWLTGPIWHWQGEVRSWIVSGSK